MSFTRWEIAAVRALKSARNKHPEIAANLSVACYDHLITCIAQEMLELVHEDRTTSAGSREGQDGTTNEEPQQ